MFERLIKSFGKPANLTRSAHVTDHELQLAAAMLMFAVLPVDHKVTADETCALRSALVSLFDFSPEEAQRMLARSAAAHANEPSIVAATTLLKHRTTPEFRQHLLHELRAIVRSDGEVHHNESDLEQRVERLLGLSPHGFQKTA
jgi:uncharacterized tellurite resistance protein B-like protein